MSKTHSLKMKGLSLLVAVAMAVAVLPLEATPALAGDPGYEMWVVAEPATVAPGETFEVRVRVDSPEAGGGLRSAEFKEFTFDHTLIQIVSMRGATEAGEPWHGATFFTAPEDEIAEANATGIVTFPIGGVFWTAPPGPTPYGEIEFVIIEMKALPGTVGTHTVPLAVDVFFMMNALLEIKTPTGTDGQVVVEGPVVDFSLAVVPDAATVPAGEAATVTANVTATLVTGSTGDVALTYSLPADVEGITVTFAPDLGQPTFTSAMTMNVTADATPGTHAITIIGGMVETTTFTLEVEEAFDFSLAVDPTVATVTQGAEVTANVTATLVAGDTEDVTLTAAGLPAGVTVTFAPELGKPTFTSTMTVAAAADATLGEHVITITGTSATAARTVPFTLTVEEALPQAIALTPDYGGPGTGVTVEGEGFPVETMGIVFAIESGGLGGEWLEFFERIEDLALLPASVITPIPFDTDEYGKFTVTATILPNAPEGEVTFVANVAGFVATAPFTVVDPSIALTPTSGCGGTEVTITGEWFVADLLGYISAKNDSTGEDVIHPVPFRSDAHGSFEVKATILPDAPLGPATFAAMEAEEVIAEASFEVTDFIPPTVAITSTAADPTNVSPIPMTATFSEDVTGFEVGDIAVGNGTAGNFTAVSGSVYTFDVTPAAEGLVTVDIAAGVATDAAGNPNEAAPQFSITYDTTAPTVAITSTASDPTNISPIPMTATFSEDVTGFEVGDITVGNGTAGNFTGTGAVYTFDVTPAADGAVTVDIAAGVATDAAGNPNEAAPGFSITYDTTAPTVEITSTASDPTNISPIPMTATFTENVTGFELVDIAVENGTADNFVPVSGSEYTFDVTPAADGEVTVDIAAGAAQDAAGNPNEAAPQFSITYDITEPAVEITSTASDPTNVSPIPMTATFSEEVTGFEFDDIAVGNGTADNFTAVSGSVYTFDVIPAAEGLVTVDIAAGVATDAAGNPNEAAPQFSITYNSASPTVEITSTASDPTNVSPIPMTATFSEDVTGFELVDIAVGNGTADNFVEVSGSEYTFDVTPAAEGLVTVDIAAGVAQDAAGNPNEAAPQFSITYDITPPDGWPSELRILGSTTVKKIADEAAGPFAGLWPNTTMNVTGTGSGTGISAIFAGNVGIGMSSRELTEDEQQEADQKGIRVYRIAADGIAIIVSNTTATNLAGPGNTTFNITRAQLKYIYERGAAIGNTTWEMVDDLNPDVNWDDHHDDNLVVPRARILPSGTRDKFHELCNITHADEETTITATGLPRLDANEDVVDAIKQNDFQIGYVGLGFIDQPGIRALKVEGVMPSVATVQDESYPLSRDLFMLTTCTNARAADFINYMFTEAGQAHVAAAGFVPVPIPADPPIRDYDVNKDNVVSMADTAPIIVHWGDTSAHDGWIRADINNDGVVSMADTTLIIVHWAETWPDPTWP